MTNFPYPERPDDDWQTAYPRDQAYLNSDKYGNSFATLVMVGFLFALVYTCFCMVRLFFFGSFSPLARGTLAILIVLLFLLLSAVILIRAFRLASGFIIEFYQPPESINLSEIINNRLFGVSKLPPPLTMLSQFKYIIIKDGEIENKDQWPAWSACNLGGPISLIIFDGCALYLERGNRFSRVVGPGEKLPFLELYETVKYVVDLRPKVKTDSFDVWTKDEIKVKFTIQIKCRIGDPSKHDPDSSLIYPYDPVAVKKAIECYSLRWPNRIDGEPSEFTWIDAAWGQVTGIVPNYVGSRTLDDLLSADQNRGQILSLTAINEIFKKLNNVTEGFGVFMIDFQILKIEIPKEVEEHHKNYWMAERQSIATILDGKAEALRIRTQAKVWADDTQRDLILAIADSLGKNINSDENEGDKE